MTDGIRQRTTATESKKPDNSAFKQQRLPAWQPVLTAKSVLPMFFVVGLVFIPVGVLIIVASNDVIEHEVDYGSCTAIKYWYEMSNMIDPVPNMECKDVYDQWRSNLSDANAISGNPPTCVCAKSFNVPKKMERNVYAYYRLTDYYQNHRRYVKSRDDVQLLAGAADLVAKHSDCDPYDQLNQTAIAPCGAIANSLFNDTFFVINCADGECSDPTFTNDQLLNPAEIAGRIVTSGKDIAWTTDKTRKFDPAERTSDRTPNEQGVPQNEVYLQNTTKPLNWRTPVATLGTDQDSLPYRFQSGSSGVGFRNEDFIVWMRTAAFPTFRKLYRKIGTDDEPADLEAGNYTLLVYFNYPVHTFGGGKYFVLATTSWIGGKNLFLGYTYTIVGGLCLIVMIVLCLISRRDSPSD